MKPFRRARVFFLSIAVAATLLSGAGSAALGVCGPFTDVGDDAFCAFVLEIFYLGITTGTTPTTFDPSSPVTRLQMAAFLSRTVDRTLARDSRRAALDQFWTSRNATVLGLTTVPTDSGLVKADGTDVWLTNAGNGTVSQVRANIGVPLQTWTGAAGAFGVVVAMGRVLVTGSTAPGRLYMVDPQTSLGSVTTVATNLGNSPSGIAFDGARFWTTNGSIPPSVSIITPAAGIPWTVTTMFNFGSPVGALYDGTHVWITDQAAKKLIRFDPSGVILQTVTLGAYPQFPAFDGANIWVPANTPDSVWVVRASNGTILQTLLGNGLNNPVQAAFDGQRVLVTNLDGDSVSLWKAADLTTLGSFSTGIGSGPYGACSDGINFWIVLGGAGRLARF